MLNLQVNINMKLNKQNLYNGIKYFLGTKYYIEDKYIYEQIDTSILNFLVNVKDNERIYWLMCAVISLIIENKLLRNNNVFEKEKDSNFMTNVRKWLEIKI